METKFFQAKCNVSSASVFKSWCTHPSPSHLPSLPPPFHDAWTAMHYPGALNPRDATCIKGLSLDLASEICWRPRLGGEEGMPCLELLIIVYQENLLPLKPEFALYTRSKHTKPYFKLFKTIMQLAWLMFV